MSTPQERLDANPELKARLSDSLARPEQGKPRQRREPAPRDAFDTSADLSEQVTSSMQAGRDSIRGVSRRGQVGPETKERLRKAFSPSRSPLWRLRRRIVRMLRPPVRTRPAKPTFEPEEIIAGHFPADKAESMARFMAEQSSELLGDTAQVDYREFLDHARTLLSYRPLNPLPAAHRAIGEALELDPDDETCARVTEHLIARGVIPSKQILEHITLAVGALDVLDGTLYDEEDDITSVTDELHEWKERFR